jgi:hypothetical protein
MAEEYNNMKLNLGVLLGPEYHTSDHTVVKVEK